MPSRIIVKPGTRFGHLVYLGDVTSVNGRRWSEFSCDCGCKKCTDLHSVRYGIVKSCGCIQKREASDRLSKQNTKHGMYGNPTYVSWSAMKSRCNNPHHKHYNRYGGRGIEVCNRWLVSFENFLSDMGPRPDGHFSIERKDVDKGYSPDNCMWIHMMYQHRNKSNTRLIEYNGLKATISEHAKLNDLSPETVRGRLNRGWTVDAALSLKPFDRFYHASPKSSSNPA